MSDKPTEGVAPVAEPAKKKGKGKLPVLLALVLVLGGGGFFAMKMKGSPAKSDVKLGEIVDMPEELVNLRSANTFARIEVSVHLREGFQKADFEKHGAAIEDALISTLRAKSLRDISTPEGTEQFKRELGAAFNAIVEPNQPTTEQPKSPQTTDAKDGNDVEQQPSTKHADWVSETGPVLKVYFRSFATQ